MELRGGQACSCLCTLVKSRRQSDTEGGAWSWSEGHTREAVPLSRGSEGGKRVVMLGTDNSFCFVLGVCVKVVES